MPSKAATAPPTPSKAQEQAVHDSMYEYMLHINEPDAMKYRALCGDAFLKEKPLQAREQIFFLYRLPSTVASGASTYEDAVGWLETLGRCLNMDAATDEGYASIHLMLRSQVVLSSLRGKTMDWKAGKKALEATFGASSQRLSKAEADRHGVLSSALEAAQKKESAKVARVLAKHPEDAVFQHVKGWVDGVKVDHLKPPRVEKLHDAQADPAAEKKLKKSAAAKQAVATARAERVAASAVEAAAAMEVEEEESPVDAVAASAADDDEPVEETLEGIIAHREHSGGLQYRFQFNVGMSWAHASKFPQYAKEIAAYDKKNKLGGASKSAGSPAPAPPPVASKKAARRATPTAGDEGGALTQSDARESVDANAALLEQAAAAEREAEAFAEKMENARREAAKLRAAAEAAAKKSAGKRIAEVAEEVAAAPAKMQAVGGGAGPSRRGRITQVVENSGDDEEEEEQEDKEEAAVAAGPGAETEEESDDDDEDEDEMDDVDAASTLPRKSSATTGRKGGAAAGKAPAKAPTGKRGSSSAAPLEDAAGDEENSQPNESCAVAEQLATASKRLRDNTTDPLPEMLAQPRPSSRGGTPAGSKAAGKRRAVTAGGNAPAPDSQQPTWTERDDDLTRGVGDSEEPGDGAESIEDSDDDGEAPRKKLPDRKGGDGKGLAARLSLGDLDDPLLAKSNGDGGGSSRYNVPRDKEGKKTKRVRFSPEEEEALRQGHALYGGSSHVWRDILQKYRVTFHNSRTAVDLKDKWRNMCKAEARG